MKSIVVASDSFKGTISSKRVIELFNEVIKENKYKVKVNGLQIADGGEGTENAIADFIPGHFVECITSDPYFNELETTYYIGEDSTAYIECAKSIGLNLVKDKLNPLKTSSYGLGAVIKNAVVKGCKHIVIGLGGSSTNDGGIGCLIALGAKAYNENNETFIPTGGTLKEISRLDFHTLYSVLKSTTFTILTDVKNPLCGTNGASYVYGPQKGATKEDIEILDQGLEHLQTLYEEISRKDIKNLVGAGAAGGLGAGLFAGTNCEFKPGIEYLLELSKFDKVIKHADYVFTGEGKYDFQSKQGKVISGILKYTKKVNIPCIVLAGGIEKEAENDIFKEDGPDYIFSTTRNPINFNEMKENSEYYLKATIQNLLKLLYNK